MHNSLMMCHFKFWWFFKLYYTNSEMFRNILHFFSSSYIIRLNKWLQPSQDYRDPWQQFPGDQDDRRFFSHSITLQDTSDRWSQFMICTHHNSTRRRGWSRCNCYQVYLSLVSFSLPSFCLAIFFLNCEQIALNFIGYTKIFKDLKNLDKAVFTPFWFHIKCKFDNNNLPPHQR